MSIVSYAQNFEDVMLWRALKEIDCGFYIDVGAWDPEKDSVTKLFYDNGWNGINIEPVGYWFERLKSQRRRDINLRLAAGAANGKRRFYEFSGSGLSTLDNEIATRVESLGEFEKNTIEVSVRTLNSICKDHRTATIHFLKIDVEGAEEQVLQGIDLSRIRPWIIVVEATFPKTKIESQEQWEHLLTGTGYLLAYRDGLNRFYIAAEHDGLLDAFQVPPNLFDAFTLSEDSYFCRPLAARKHQLSNQLSESRRQCRQLDDRLQQRNRELESIRTELGQRVAELEKSIQHWRDSADQYRRRLQTVQASWSWRVTWPMRKLLEVARLLPAAPGKATVWLFKALLRRVRRLLVALIDAVFKHRGLRNGINTWQSNHPRANAALRRWVLGPRVERYAGIGTADGGNLSVAQLTPYARRIHAGFKAALDRQQKRVRD